MILGCILALSTLSYEQKPAPTAPVGLRCRMDAVEDTEKSKMVAYTYLVPNGWTSHQSMRWVTDDSFTASLAVTTPDKRYSVDQFEPLLVSYTEPKDAAPIGIHIVHATDFLHAAVKELNKQFGVENVKLGDELNEPLRDSAGPDQVKAGGDVRTSVKESGYLKVSYQVGGQEEILEMATTVTGYNVQSSSTGSTTGRYQVGPTTMIVMPAKPAPESLKEIQLTVSSMASTSQFSAYLRKKVEKPLETPSPAQDKDAQDKTFWLLRSMSAFCEQMSSKDASTQRFCSLFTPLGTYRAQDGSVIILPTSYGHVWSDGEGGYVFTDAAPADVAQFGSKWQELHKG